MPVKRTIHWSPCGPLMYVRDRNVLHIEDLNPQLETKWVLTRWEMLRMGLRLVQAALRAEANPLKLK